MNNIFVGVFLFLFCIFVTYFILPILLTVLVAVICLILTCFHLKNDIPLYHYLVTHLTKTDRIPINSVMDRTHINSNFTIPIRSNGVVPNNFKHRAVYNLSLNTRPTLNVDNMTDSQWNTTNTALIQQYPNSKQGPCLEYPSPTKGNNAKFDSAGIGDQCSKSVSTGLSPIFMNNCGSFNHSPAANSSKTNSNSDHGLDAR